MHHSIHAMTRLLPLVLASLMVLWTAHGFAEVRARSDVFDQPGAGASGHLTPSGTVNGDLELAWVAVFPNTGTVTQPTGWTLLTSLVGSGNDALYLFSHTASGEPASTSWTFSGSSYIDIVSLYDAGGNSLSVDGTQYTCNNTSVSGPLTFPNLTASVTWDAAVGFSYVLSATHQYTTISNNSTVVNEAFGSSNAFSPNMSFHDAPASGSTNDGTVTAILNENTWQYCQVLVKGAGAPVNDWRLRDSQTYAASAVNNPGNSGDLLVVGCADISTTTVFTAPDGTWTAGATNTGQGSLAVFSKKTTATGGSIGSFGSAGGCKVDAFYDNGGSTLKVQQSVASSAVTIPSALNATAPNITPTAVNNIILQAYFPVRVGITGDSFNQCAINTPQLCVADALTNNMATSVGASGGFEFSTGTSVFTPPGNASTVGEQWEMATVEIAKVASAGQTGIVIVP